MRSDSGSMNAAFRTGAAGRPSTRLMVVCVHLAIGFAGILGLAQAHSQTHSLVGKPAPEFVRHDLDGRAIDLAQLRGRVVLINFWATWCAPCQAEMPEFATWQQEHGSQGLSVIGISMDDDAETARRLVKKLRLTYPVAMGDARLGKQYGGVLGLPTTFLVSREGAVLAEFKGQADLKAMETQVTEALSRH
jgi:peroxiredoxin